MNKIPYGRQSISEADIEAVVEVLRSDFLTQGPAVERFERALASYSGARYAVAVSNATAALHIGADALGIGPGDRVWTSPNTFVASANCALYLGATVDFVDIDPVSYNLSVPALEVKLAAAKASGTLPKLVIPVHHSGQSCEMARIHELSREYGFRVMEDASHAIGGSYRGGRIGGGQHSDLTVFSFHPVKIVTTGEGGALLTNDEALYQKLVRLRSHGITRDPAQMTHAPEGPWYYQQIDLGWNYRITDIQAALGTSQLARIDALVRRRHEVAAEYRRGLAGLPLRLPEQDPDTHSAYHLYVVRLELDKIRRSQRAVFEELHQRGIYVNLHYIPVHRQPYYERLGFRAGQFPEAERYYAEAVSLPMFPTLSAEEQAYVIASLREILA